MTPTRDDVLAAAERIAGRVRRTPLLSVGPDLVLKLEHLQHTGSFKARGAFNRALSALASGEVSIEAGVVAASGGNAGLAHAFAASALGLPATVFVPRTAPPVKVARLRALGADVRQVGEEYADAYDAALTHADRHGALFCHAYDQPAIVAGAGTLAEEVLADDPAVDTIVVAVGGGGLFAGVATAAAGRAHVVAVEPVLAPTLHSALAAGEPVDVAVSGVAADSLGARRVGDIAFAVATRTSPTSLLVSEEQIVEARRRLWSDYRIASEHGAATAYAALTSGAYVPAEGEQVCVVVCGANTDPATLDF